MSWASRPENGTGAIEHDVQFYGSAEKLCRIVAEYLAAGLSAGESVLAVLTKEHEGRLVAELRERGVDVDAEVHAGRIVLLDAAETLSRIVVGGRPDAARFRDVIGEAIAKNLVGKDRTRAYGEMVDLLWSGGNRRAAVELEELWTALRSAHDFSLLRAYRTGDFYTADELERVRAIHDAAAPGDESRDGPAAPDLRALAAEVAHRREIERTLGDSIADLRSTEDRLRKSQRETDRLVTITAAVADAVKADEVYDAVVDQVAHALGASTAGLWVVNEDERFATLVRSVGYSEETLQTFGGFSLDDTIPAPALDTARSGRPLFISSREELVVAYPHLALAIRRPGSYRTACLPLFAQGRIAGVVGFTFDDAPPFDEDDRTFLTHVARHSGQALERLSLLERDHEGRVRAELLYRLAASVIQAERVEEVFSAALDAIEQALHASRSSVLTYDADGVLRFKAWRGLSDGYRAAVEGHSPWTRDTRNPEPIFVSDVNEEASLRGLLPVLEREGIRSLGFIPLGSGGQLFGKFMVYYDEPLTLRPQQVSLTLAIANHVAAAVARFAAVEELQQTVRFNEMFTAILGHDLRNPLGAIMTAAQLVLRREGTERHHAPLSRIMRSGERMARMIDQLLDFTRVRVGAGIPLAPRPVDLAFLLQHILDELDGANPACKLVLEHSGDLRGVWDEDRLAQVFSILVGNAVQHGEAEGGVRVTVDGTQRDVVDVRVHNLGAVPEALVPKLFHPMMGGEWRRANSHGLGLGLFITEQIVKAHRGTILVCSTPEDGTRFTVTLPRQAQLGAG